MVGMKSQKLSCHCVIFMAKADWVWRCTGWQIIQVELVTLEVSWNTWSTCIVLNCRLFSLEGDTALWGGASTHVLPQRLLLSVSTRTLRRAMQSLQKSASWESWSIRLSFSLFTFTIHRVLMSSFYQCEFFFLWKPVLLIHLKILLNELATVNLCILWSVIFSTIMTVIWVKRQGFWPV